LFAGASNSASLWAASFGTFLAEARKVRLSDIKLNGHLSVQRHFAKMPRT